MKPRVLIQARVERFNKADYNGLADLYSEHCMNYQAPNGIVEGGEQVRMKFKEEFSSFDIGHCLPLNERNERSERSELPR